MPFAETSNGRVYCESHGQGLPLIVAPAFGASARTYRGLLPNLSDGYRVVLYDLRGMGQSDPMPEGTTLASMADDVAAVLDHLEIDRITVIGPSMGAIIAQQFAVRHRDRLDRLVLVTPPARKSRYRRAINEILTDLLTAHPAERVVRHMVHLALSPNFVDKHPVVVDQMMRGIEVSDGDRATMLRLLMSSYEFDGIDGLAAMDAPTLIIAGELDLLTPPSQAKILHETLPNSTLRVMAGVGHSPFIENTRETFAAVLAFLADGSGREPPGNPRPGELRP